jgi:hypothetical protein
VSGVEGAALRLGSAVVTRVAISWLAERRASQRRGLDLTALLAKRYPEIKQQRAMRRELEKIEEEVARRLEPFIVHEFRAVDEGEQRSAINAVTDLLEASDLSDEVLMGIDLDHRALASELASQKVGLELASGLGEGGRALFSLALEQACWWLVTLVRELPEFSSATAIEVLRRSTETMAKLDDIRAQLPIVSLDAPRGSAHDEEFRRRYYSYLIGTRGFIELLGVSTRNYRHHLPIEDAYLSLRASQDGRGQDVDDHSLNPALRARWYAPPSGRNLWSDFGSLRVEAALSRSSHTLLRGEAGSGKTTFLDWLAVTAAKGTFPEVLDTWNGLVPFAIRLRSYVGASLPRPEHFVAHSASWLAGLEPEGWTHRQLTDGRALLLVDGVDELPVSQRDTVRKWLHGLVTTWPSAKVVVTSRPTAASARWLEDLGFTSVVLERMRTEDIRRFIQSWHASAAKSDSLPCDIGDLLHYQTQLLGGLETRSDLQALATNPLLCAMLCAVNADRGGSLPNDRMAVYKAALEMLLERRDTDREMAVPLTAPISSILLQDLAWRLSLNNRSEISRAHAVGYLARKIATMPNVDQYADDLLQHLIDRSGVIREPVVGRIDFVHRAFQEYFAAAEVAEEDHIGALIERAHLDNWREVAIMTCGHANRRQRAELIEGILDRAHAEPRNRRTLKFLAASCLANLSDLDPVLLARVDDSMQSFIPPKTEMEARALSSLGSWILTHMPIDTSSLRATTAAATVQAVGLTGSTAALSTLAGYASDARPEVQDELARMWPYFPVEAYAESVLGEAPLADGRIEIQDITLLPHLDKLQYLQSVAVSILDDPLTSLDMFENVPLLTDLHVNAIGTIDLRPLIGKSRLRSLGVAGPAELQNLEILHELSALKDLTLFNLQRWSDIEFLTQLPDLESLTLAALEDVPDFAPLRSVAQLTNLQLYDCARLIDLSCISHLGDRLEWLTLSGSMDDRIDSYLGHMFPMLNGLFLIGFANADIAAFARMPLERLWVQGCKDVDLAGAGALRQLERLDIDFAENIYNLASLADLPHLREIRIRGDGGPIDISPLQGMKLVLNVSAGRTVVGTQSGSNVKIRHVN